MSRVRRDWELESSRMNDVKSKMRVKVVEWVSAQCKCLK